MRSTRYFLGFGSTALVLGGLTLFLVLVVLPRRYVLNAGLRESGMSFPSQAAPFAPPRETRRQPLPPPPPAPVVVRGPAEVFWDEVGPLLEQHRFGRALPIFEAYLTEHPDDTAVRREYAITLQKADRPDQAALQLNRLLEEEDEPPIRLLLARVLRDLGRVEEASTQYAVLRQQRPDDLDLALEWGKALAWAKHYEEAVRVLTGAMEADSSAAALRVELARVYYWSGRLDDADDLLRSVDLDALERADGLSLRDDLAAALVPPADGEEGNAVPTPGPATPLEKAVEAQARQDFEGAATFYAEAIRSDPQDATLWKGYADVLQFGLEDLEGAREALLEVENLGEKSLSVRFRLAQLDIWTGRNGDAFRRLERLLDQLAETADAAEFGPDETADAAEFGPDETAEIRALLGDLRKWEGDRVRSGDEYALALELDSLNARAQAGLDDLAEETSRDVEEVERPRLGGNAYSLVDSDDFARLDLGAEGVRIDGKWVWAMRTGSRWLGGLDLSGADRQERGLFLEMESARWWKWGTLRTGVHLGLEQTRPDATDVAFGASLHFSDLGGFRSDFRFDHGPAYPLTVTLQSALAQVSMDRLTASLARQLGPRWSLSAAGDAALIHPGASTGASSSRGSLRLESGVSVGRSLTDDLILGVNARALAYTRASPAVGGLRLFWDPRALLSSGLYAQWDRKLLDPLRLSVRLNPSLAFIDERTGSGFQTVPHLSAEAGLSHLGRRFRTTLDAYYYQGRFDGYRAYGLRLSFSARDWFGGRGAR